MVAYQALSRYVPLLPRLLWTEEAARFCFVWMVLLGAAVAVRAGTHFTVDVLPASLSPRTRRLLDLATLALVTLAVAVLLVGGVRFTWLGRGRVSTTSGLPLAWVYAAFPVAALAMLAFLAERITATARGREGPDERDPLAPGRDAGAAMGGQ